MSDPRPSILETLRGRILRGVQSGTLRSGDRLPSARDLAPEFDADYRQVVAAYRELAVEGLVEMRPRGGVYVAARPATSGGVPPLSEAWLADVLTQGLAREVRGPELHEWLRRCTETLRLRAVVVASTVDQQYGLCRELRDDFGLEAEALAADELRGAPGAKSESKSGPKRGAKASAKSGAKAGAKAGARSNAPPPLAVRRADLLVTTPAHAEWVRALGAGLRKPVIVVDVRPELTSGEWSLLLRQPVYAVVATPEFGDMLRRFFAAVPGVENLRVLVFGRDDLTTIPDGAPTYVTQRVRAQAGEVPIAGRLLPAARTIAAESARELFAFIVHANVEAMSRRER